MHFIDDKAVESVLRMEELIPLMRHTMVEFSLGQVTQPARRIIPVQAHAGYFGSMPAASAHSLGAKLITYYPANDQKKLPTHMAMIVLFKPETGEPIAVMDGRVITDMRTAAVSAVFVDTAAGKDVQSLAILGAGVQGRSHFEALSQVRKFEDIRIWNRTPARAEALAESVGARATGCEEAVRGAEVVVVATSSSEPVLDGSWLRDGAKVVSVGWAGADGGELDAITMSHTVIVDSREGALTESGNILLYGAEIYAELGEVLNGARHLEPADTVVFDSIGMAAQDVAAASMVLDKLSSG